jgi:hypothetical protein
MAGLNRMDSKAPRAHQEIGRLLPLLCPIGNKFEREGTRAAITKTIILGSRRIVMLSAKSLRDH